MSADCLFDLMANRWQHPETSVVIDDEDITDELRPAPKEPDHA